MKTPTRSADESGVAFAVRRGWGRTMGGYVAAAAGVVGVLVLLLWIAGTFHRKTPEGRAPPWERLVGSAPVVEVKVIVRPRLETAVGTVKPVHEVSIASKLLARVVEVKVNAGQVVKRGDVLIRLDDAELLARQSQLEARLQGAKAAAERAATDLARTAKLRQANVVSQAEFEQSSATSRTTAAEVDQAAQTLIEAQALLSQATLVAPLDGLVVEKSVDSGDTVTPGQVLLTMYDPGHMQMVASVRESLASRLKVGQSVVARLESLDYECAATVSEIVPEAQAASRSFLVKVTGPCPPGIYSGLFGRIEVPLEDERVTVVPTAAVRHVGQLDLVDVVVEGKLQRRSVQLGRRLDDDDEVLSGLEAGERVAISTPASPAAPRPADLEARP